MKISVCVQRFILFIDLHKDDVLLSVIFTCLEETQSLIAFSDKAAIVHLNLLFFFKLLHAERKFGCLDVCLLSYHTAP